MTDSPRKMHLALKIILPLLILVIGVGGFKMLVKMKKTPHRQASHQQGVLVDVVKPVPGDYQITVHATGTVRAAREISLVPEVSGKVVEISPKLVSGGRFRKGEVLLKIDPGNYQLALEKAYADIARAEVALATEQEQAKIALDEWQRIEIADKGEPGPLVTREIQLKQQRANLAAAQANLKLARLNLDRTTLKAPFNGRISQEQVDIGQYLRAGSSIGKLSGTDRAEIYVPLPYSELRWLKIPAVDAQQKGSRAEISLPGHQPHWQGFIIRSLGEIDPATRMATVVVAVDNPYDNGEKGQSPASAALETGMFVDIQLKGQTLKNIVTIPRTALRNNHQVWIVDSDNRLHIKQVEVARREKERLLISSGLTPADRIVTTSLSAAANGMLLRPAGQELP